MPLLQLPRTSSEVWALLSHLRRSALSQNVSHLMPPRQKRKPWKGAKLNPLFDMIATLKRIAVNWKTTVTGIAAVGSGITLFAEGLGANNGDLDPDKVQAGWAMIMSGASSIAIGVGLIFARDMDKSSQDNEVRP